RLSAHCLQQSPNPKEARLMREKSSEIEETWAPFYCSCSSYMSTNFAVTSIYCCGIGPPTAIAVKCVFSGRITFWNVFASRHSRCVFEYGLSKEPLIAMIGIDSFVRSTTG